MKRLRYFAPAAMVVALAICLFAVRCTTTDTRRDETGGDSHIHIDALDPHDSPPEVVARNAITIMLSWRPRDDGSPWQALHRAAPLLTGKLATAAAAPPNPAPRPIPQWQSWADAGDTVTAAASNATPAHIDSDSATVELTITQTVLHSDGQSTPYRRAALTIELSRHGDESWRVSEYSEDLP